MLTRIMFLVRLLLWWLFDKVTFEPRQIATIRAIAAESRILYVLQTRSLFDYLYFNFAFHKHGLPLARWSNGPGTLHLAPLMDQLRFLFRRRDRRPQKEQMLAALHHHRAGLLFLERPGFSEKQSAASSQPFLATALEDLAADTATPIHLVPMLVVWERRSASFEPSRLPTIFGSPQAPGLLRRLLHVLKNLWRPFFSMGAPLVLVREAIDLRTWHATQPAADDAALSLQRHLVEILEKERETVVGPKHRSAAHLKRDILEAPAFQEELARIAAENQGDLRHLQKEARRNLNRMASQHSMLAIKIVSTLLTPVWHLIYDGLEVDLEGLDKVRAAARDARLVIVPSHKSHIDYLIISYLFFLHGLTPPHITAGENLNFPPVGGILRRGGAFFIRRSFKGDQVYALCLSAYIAHILQAGHSLEFFIEGGRSRTGKLLAPRFGILKMVVEAYCNQAVDRIKLVPCAVTYEKVIEDKAHHAEIVGGEKKRENLGNLLRSTKILTSRYGRLYVTFGEPLDLADFFPPVAPQQPQPALVDQGQVESLGYRILHEINRAGTVTTSAVLSMVLLNHPQRRISRERMLHAIGFVLSLLLAKGARLSPPIQTILASRRVRLREEACQEPGCRDLFFLVDPVYDANGPDDTDIYRELGHAMLDLVDEALHLFADANLVEFTRIATGEHETTFYAVPEKARGQLAYYKNMVLHTLLTEALVATAMCENGELRAEVEELRENLRWLAQLFKYEFVFGDENTPDHMVETILSSFAERGWLSHHNDHIVALPWPSPPIAYLRGLTLTFLEAYALVASASAHAPEAWQSEASFIEEIMMKCSLRYHEGTILYQESLAKPTFENALRRLIEMGGLDSKSESKRNKTQRFIRARAAQQVCQATATRLQAFLQPLSARPHHPAPEPSPRP